MTESNPHLFTWETDDMPQLQRLILIIEHLPYQEIVGQRSLDAAATTIRSKPCSDPDRRRAFGHDSLNSPLRELA